MQNAFVLNAQSIALIRELGDHMPGGFFIYRAEAPEELLYANKPVFDIYGCSDLEDFKQLTGYTFKGMVHPEDYRRISDSIVEQIERSDDNMDYAEYRIIRKDGAVRWVDDYGHYMDTDEYGGVYTVFISDITERRARITSTIDRQKATIEDLNQSFRRLHAEQITFSRVAQALAKDFFSIYVVDPDTESFVEYSSTDAYDRLGIEKSGENFFDVSRRNMARILFPEDRDVFLAIFKKDRVMAILERDGAFTTKYRLMMDGEPVYVSMKATLLVDQYGRHLIIGTNNINAQMQREQEFQKNVTEARNRAKNDFLANMSHDIRTPMNAIVGYTNIANSHLDDPAVVKDSLEKISSSSHFLLSLINDVLDMSKIESGKMQLSMGECDLEAILKRIEDITSLQATKKSLSISYRRDGLRHTRVRGDELRIEQILINIISNAIKYTPDGGRVDMLAEEEPTGDAHKNLYRFVIADTGIGISEDYLPHIFDSFTREQSTTINRIQGTGLGLAITAKVVEQMGGKITVESAPGKGSRFTVELTLESSEAFGSGGGANAEEDVDLAGRSILLVEDNDINAEIASMILGQFGMDVERAENGLVAVEKAKAGRFDAVLMDIQMPVMNGYEATRAIRALEEKRYRSIPIIAISANAYDEDVRDCLAAGMDAHIAKPFDPQELIRLMKREIHNAADRAREG
ncbi:MAG: response regulator [Clostridiales bacterium]|nr:response regulator [Clostridiales bacterium]